MKKYCYIENNKVISANQGLPKTWKNISGFDNLPDSILKTYGWLPFVRETEGKRIFVSSNYVIEENLVKEIIITRDKNEQELEKEQEEKLQNQWIQVREQRDELLRVSDLFVLIDRWENLSNERKEKIRTYRQTLRDVPSSFNNPYEIIWPEL